MHRQGILGCMQRGLGWEFLNSLVSLKPGDKVFDSGSGYAISLMQLTQKKGVTGFAANRQDFWKAFKDLQYIKKSDLEYSPESDDYVEIEKVGFIEERVLRKLLKDLGFPLKFKNKFKKTDFDKVILGIKQNVKKALELKEELVAKKSFFYKLGFSEKILEKEIERGNRFKLVVDFYGAFTYSADRLKLIELIYNSLTDDGVSFIVCDKIFREKVDEVYIGGKKEATLIDFLTKNYSDIIELKKPEEMFFEMEDNLKSYRKLSKKEIENIKKESSKNMFNVNPASYPVLILRKNPKRNKLEFDYKFDDKGVIFHENYQFVVPYGGKYLFQ